MCPVRKSITAPTNAIAAAAKRNTIMTCLVLAKQGSHARRSRYRRRPVRAARANVRTRGPHGDARSPTARWASASSIRLRDGVEHVAPRRLEVVVERHPQRQKGRRGGEGDECDDRD